MKSKTLLYTALGIGGYSFYRNSQPAQITKNEFNGSIFYKQKNSDPMQEPNELKFGEIITINLDAISTPLFKDRIFLCPPGSKVSINTLGEIHFVGLADSVYNLYYPSGWLDKKSDWYQKRLLASDNTYDKLFSKNSSFLTI